MLKGSCFLNSSTIKNLEESDIIAPVNTNEDDRENEDMETESSSSEPTKSKAAKKSKPIIDIHPAAELVADFLIGQLKPVSYTHLTLPTNREV